MFTQESVLARELSRAEPPTDAPLARRRPWADSYVRRLAVTDFLGVVTAAVVAQLVRFGTRPADLSPTVLGYTPVSTVLVGAWLLTLAISRSRDAKIVGSGAEEYTRVARASFALFGTVAILAFLLKIDLARGYLAVALPFGLAVLITTRWSWRRWLVRQRAVGRFTSTVLVVGSHGAAARMADTFERSQTSGYRVAGVCVPGWRPGGEESLRIQSHLVPVLGDEQSVLEALQSTAADVVAVSNTESLGADGMRTLAWQLEAVDVDLVVTANVVDVAGPRLHVRPVAGLPWLYVDKPQYAGASRVGKLALDLLGSVAALVVLWPLMLVVALAIKLDSRGPVFYRAERIGLNGRPFAMLKFRSMVAGADSHRRGLANQNEGAGPLFKIRRDPRVTRVGGLIRRTSIDELPQLINVLLGQMSIVGPRPPLRHEVDAYSGEVHRRLLVKPGITGLWQVSGRSNLSWEESVRLDLYYVENWSMIQDLIIVWRTVGAVLRSTGAY